MNKQFDIIIIGDSPEGVKALKKLAGTSRQLKIAFVSRAFKSTTTRDFLNVEYIKDDLLLIDYKAKLFGCYLKSGLRLYSTHVVLASGLKYANYLVNGKPAPNVFNTATDISKLAKNLPAVVVGHDTAAVKLALSVAKKYRQVYVCMNVLNPVCSDALKAKLDAANNIVLLPNASITKVHTSKGVLDTVELSNYSQITCKAIFVKTASTPETGFVSTKLINKDSAGYCITNNQAESTLVPKLFAIGSCAAKSPAKQQEMMIKAILADFTEVK